MPLTDGDWKVTRSSQIIEYTGGDHDSSPTYATVIEFHRWLQGLADDAVASGLDELDITNTDPSRRSTDNIITLINGYSITDATAEHLYDGSIIQNSGDDIYDGFVNFGNADVQIQIIQNGAVLTDDWWNVSGVGLNPDSGQGISHRFMLKTRTGGADVDGRRVIGTTRTFGNTFGEFKVNGTARGNNVLALNDSTDLNNVTGIGTIAALSDIYISRVVSSATVSGVNSTGQAVLNVSDGTQFTKGDFIMIAGDDDEYQIDSIATNALTLNHNLATATTGGEATYDLSMGFTQIDVNNDTTNEDYYSQWDRGGNSINTFYERLKWLSRDGTAEYVYGISGELFRGITHEITVDTPTGTFAPAEAVSWTGGTGQMFAINSPTAGTLMWIQLLTGVAPTNGLTITGGISTATADVETGVTDVVDRSSLISTPFVGASTGSAIIGSYGLGIEIADLTSSDKVFDLTNAQIDPPNNVTNTVSGLIHGEDRVLVVPWDGSATDTNGDPDIHKIQLDLTSTLNTADVATIQVSTGAETAVPSDTPSSGVLRVTDDDGYERWIPYSSWSGTTFTVDTGHADIGSNNDFDGSTGTGTYQATAANNVYIAYVDELAVGTVVTAASGFTTGVAYVIKTVGTTDFTAIGAATNTIGVIFTATGAGSGSGDAYTQSTTASFTSVQSGSRSLVLIVRDGASTPIKQYISSWSQSSSDQSISVIRTTDA